MSTLQPTGKPSYDSSTVTEGRTEAVGRANLDDRPTPENSDRRIGGITSRLWTKRQRPQPDTQTAQPDTQTAQPDTQTAQPRLVLVHGSLDRAASFQRVTRRLGGWDVTTYDRRGYDHSLRSGPTATFSGHVEDLLCVVEELQDEGQGRAVVIGHSFGGLVALGAAASNPHMFSAVGAYEPPTPWAPWWPKPAIPLTAQTDPAEYAKAFFRVMVGGDAWDRLNDAARRQRIAEGEALAAESLSIASHPPFDLGAVRVPTSVAYGSASGSRHRQGSLEVAEAIDGAEAVEIPGPAHGAHLSHPGAFANWVVRTARLSLPISQVERQRSEIASSPRA